MSKTKGFLSVVAVAAMVITFSCSSDSDGGGGGGDTQGGVSSSSDDSGGNSQSYSYCLLSEERICLDGPFTSKDCNTAGGHPSNSCPYGGVEPSSNSEDTSSSSGVSSSVDTDDNPSSSGIAPSSGSVEPSSSSGVSSSVDTDDNPSSSGIAPSSGSVEPSSSSGVSSSVETDNNPSSSSVTPSSSSSEAVIFGYCDYGPLAEYSGGCFPMTTDEDAQNCAMRGQVVEYCPPANYCDYGFNDGCFLIGTSEDLRNCNKWGNRNVVSSCPSDRRYCNYRYNGDSSCFPIDTDSDKSMCAVGGIVVSSCPSSSSSSIPSSSSWGGGSTCSADLEEVTIGSQVWAKKNLNCDVEGSKCLLNNPANCDKYGRLYDWATAMNLPPTCNSSYTCRNQVQTKHQGICPSGWHIPSDEEWTALTDYIGYYGTAGTQLKATSGWDNNRNGTDYYGFSALPGGLGYSDGRFDGGYGIWWSATQSTDIGAYFRVMRSENYIVERSGSDKSNLYSVRCVQD